MMKLYTRTIYGSLSVLYRIPGNIYFVDQVYLKLGSLVLLQTDQCVLYKK